jgi:hypothetical protein
LNRGNPLIQALSLIVAAALLGLAFVIGAVVIGVLLALGAIATIAVAVRIWWLQRKAREGAVADRFGERGQPVIEGDYTVVGESDAKTDHARSIGRDDPQSRPRDASR